MCVRRCGMCVAAARDEENGRANAGIRGGDVVVVLCGTEKVAVRQACTSTPVRSEWVEREHV